MEHMTHDTFFVVVYFGIFFYIFFGNCATIRTCQEIQSLPMEEFFLLAEFELQITFFLCSQQKYYTINATFVN